MYGVGLIDRWLGSGANRLGADRSGAVEQDLQIGDGNGANKLGLGSGAREWG